MLNTHTKTIPLLKRLVKEAVAPYSTQLALAIFCMLIVAATTAGLAWLMDPVVNQVFVEKRSDLLWLIGGAVFAVFLTKGLATYCQTVIMAGVGQNVLMDMQKRLFAHLMTQDLLFFKTTSSGELMSRFSADITMMRQAVSTALTGIGKDFFSLIFLVIVMFFQDWLLALIAVFVFPATVVPITSLGRRLRHVTADTQAETGVLMNELQQTFTSIQLIQSFGMQVAQMLRISAMVAKIRNMHLRAEKVKAISSPLMETVGGVAVTIVIVYGGWRVINDTTTPGAFFSFITALLMAYRPIKALANLNSQIQQGLAGAERLFSVLDTKPNVVEQENAKELICNNGRIIFRDVNFTYPDGSVGVKNLNFVCESGSVTAFVGPSGSGKTTLLNLIIRLFDIDSGSIQIDDNDITDLTFSSLRNNVGVVSQDMDLFNDTVMNNIRMGNPHASEQEVQEAATLAGADSFIHNLSYGYNTIVGERGKNLSGGERQRICIARAALKKPKILLLDEATNSLDSETGKYVQSSIGAMNSNCTSILVAHDLSSIQHANCIHVLTNGEISESGTHSELINKNGKYAMLYRNHIAETQ